jgi:hypothetical protein
MAAQVEMSVHHPTFGPEVYDNQEHLETIQKFLTDINFGDEDVDLNDILLRPVFKPATTLSITLLFYFVLIVFGIVGNTIVLRVLYKRKMYKSDNIQACVLNLTLAFLLQLFLVIPLSLFVLVVHNWVLGSFLCYSLPIIQVIII